VCETVGSKAQPLMRTLDQTQPLTLAGRTTYQKVLSLSSRSMSVTNARYEDGHDNLEPIAQVSCGIAAGIVADTRLRSVGVWRTCVVHGACEGRLRGIRFHHLWSFGMA
jgi:hypothetical protein